MSRVIEAPALPDEIAGIPERMEAYRMDGVLDRTALAYGAAPEWIKHVAPVRRVEGVKVKTEEGWVDL